MLRSRVGIALVALVACQVDRGPSTKDIVGETYSPELAKRLDAALVAKGADYVPRTRHLTRSGAPKYTNRLILESSPYLLQHAHNPVNWYAWGDEAFEAARRLNRPVFVSIGYATCHWCHVMEEESFEDEAVARYINANYIAIKVDREERPDVDAVYITAVEQLSGRAGWPLNVWLTPDRVPFFGGTYFPPDDPAAKRPGFMTVLRELRGQYDASPEDVAKSAARIQALVRQELAGSFAGSAPSRAAIDAAMAEYRRLYDPVNGGLARVKSKFPSALPIRLLLRYHRRTGDAAVLEMAETTLQKMAAGGIYDHVGGGFHRYATDSKWLVPHFEKMLYDNAALAVAYLEAYQVTGKTAYADVARDIFEYVTRDMTSPAGAFYSATDADSETPSGERDEGWYFTWTTDEVDELLGAKRAYFVRQYFGMSARGNFEGRNVLHTPRPLEDVAKELRLDAKVAHALVGGATSEMYVARKQRPAPLLDDKIIAAWNGLMISAYARAALALGEDEYAAKAARAAEFVLAEMRVDGRLMRTYRAGEARGMAYLEDYAFVIGGLIDLFEATGERRWLDESIALCDVAREHYEDAAGGGFYRTANDAEELLARQKPNRDGALPSGNSVMALNLLRLYELTSAPVYRERADALLAAFGALFERNPRRLADMLLAVDYRTEAPAEIVIVVPNKRADAAALLVVLGETFVPNRVVAVVRAGEHAERIPLVEAKTAQGGKATAYVCERGACELPTSDPAVFRKQIAKVRVPAVGQKEQ